ncbi:hypothetical protein NIIDMKKI_25900 [Mycobacterium kansasii]|uniref:Uncharacterized protein n=1 Tax=Mycobacterium kansasii TaxID=1768 RepID=A0A7G1IA90_MYCKA|nr:hypothetical protein NIIDMKKI_25900 [Mycobacterium kansasii]
MAANGAPAAIPIKGAAALEAAAELGDANAAAAAGDKDGPIRAKLPIIQSITIPITCNGATNGNSTAVIPNTGIAISQNRPAPKRYSATVALPAKML